MSYIVKMATFSNVGHPSAYKTLPGAAPTLADAVKRGRAEIALSTLESEPIGYLIFDGDGAMVDCWKLGDAD